MKISTIAEFRRYLSFDEARGTFSWKVDKGTARAGDVAGRSDKRGYRVITIAGHDYKAHRLVWFFYYGEWPNGLLDHANGVKDDNRLDNLRLATPSQNAANQLPSRQHLPKGVHPHGRRFRAEIKKDGVKYRLGSFETVEAAAQAYANGALALYGEFGRAN